MDAADAVLFDLDGTLVNTEPRNRAVWTRYLAELGIPPDGILDELMGRRGADVFAERPELSRGRTLDEVRARLADLHAQPDLPPVTLLPTSIDFLRTVHASGVPVGVVTSATRQGADAMLDWLGVRDLLSGLVTGGDVTVGKPDPQGYLYGARTLGVSPRRTLAVEDSPAGVAAARAAGMTCVAVTTTHAREELGAADRVVAALDEIDWPPPGHGGG
ncbi:HAD family phosphatase [Lipingzhangella sp. LS1_29]|uniref:HAD family phosphatase n=1 Tax=Lipingzhangella rawalii TaxID=2055835 RepID=A0ABU2H543_9ACTN|nr:HAD family phosphatase [Lipingzhangella rawalii]MDS1270427.1 HAD family phosphatase [Lipingzhangella rawalii]